MNIVYLHGLSSSGQSITANKLRELFSDGNVIARIFQLIQMKH